MFGPHVVILARMRRLTLAVLLVLTGCSSGGADNAVGFTAVDLTATPEALATHNDLLVIGTRPVDHPELVTRSSDGRVSNSRLTPATPYGKEAHWYGITSDGTTITGVGGERGGAHGNVRWSAWTGDTRAITEKPQAFSTFGGYGAGELIGANLYVPPLPRSKFLPTITPVSLILFMALLEKKPVKRPLTAKEPPR